MADESGMTPEDPSNPSFSDIGGEGVEPGNMTGTEGQDQIAGTD